MGSAIRAQEPLLYHYSVKDGLPSREVHSVFQDSKGYIWLSTDCGICKYDANTFKTFSTYDGMPDNTVFEVMEDNFGRLWYRTFLGGIGYIRNDSVYTIKANKKIVELQGKGLVQSFAVDGEGRLLLGLTNDQCFFIRISPPFGEENLEKLNAGIKGRGLEGRVIGDRLVFSENRNFRILNSSDMKNLSRWHTHILVKDEQGHLLITDSIQSDETKSLSRFFLVGNEIIYASGNKLRTYDLASKTRRNTILAGDVITLLKADDKLMIGYRFRGVEELAFSGSQAGPLYLENLSITCIRKDRSGGCWISTLEDGIYYCPGKNYFKLRLSGIYKEKSIVTSWLKDSDSTFLAGTQSGSVYSYKFGRGGINETTVYKDEKDRVILKLCKLNSREYILDKNGIESERYKAGKNGKLTLSGPIPQYKTFYRFKNLRMGLVVKHGELLDTNGRLIKRVEFNDRTTSLAVDTAGEKVYAGSWKGLYVFGIKDERPPQKMSLNLRIEDLCMTNNRLFIATKTNGLIVMQGNVYDTISIGNGLVSNICRKLFFDGKEIWMIANNGISRIRYSAYKKYAIENYAFSENFFPERIDNLGFFNNSLVFFDKSDMFFFPLSGQAPHPDFRISSVLANGKIQYGKTRFDIDYDQTDLSVNFEAMFYANNRSILYRYKFDNDSVWKYTEKSSLYFPALAPGSYVLKLQARRNNGEWVSCENELSFFVAKPFWLKWWFMLLMGATGVSVLALIVLARYKRKLDRERARNLLENKMRELEIKVIKAQMNPHFISNSLSAIQELIYSDHIEKAGQYIAKFSFFVRESLHLTDSMFTTLSKELEIIRLNIELEKLRFENFDFAMEVEDGIKLNMIRVPSLVTQPFVENAIWHGLLPLKNKRKPKLIVRVSFESGSVFVDIIDNGVGRNNASMNDGDVSKGTKLVYDKVENINRLVQEVNCRITIIDLFDADGLPGGTKVRIQLINSEDGNKPQNS